MDLSKFSRYTVQARIAPALLAVLPLIALALALIPALPGAQRLWSLVAFPVVLFASSTARERGNAVQAEMWEAWDGAPTTRRLRFRGAASAREVEYRHCDIEGAVGGGLRLPTREEEQREPGAADAEYIAATRRLIGCVRHGERKFPLLDAENRNYGFSRNLRGLRSIGRGCCIVALALSAIIGGAVAGARGPGPASVFLLPALTAIVMLGLWPMVTEAWVRPSAEAYADRLMEAAQILKRGTTTTGSDDP